MNILQTDIVVELRLQADGTIDANSLIHVFDALETAIYASDRNDVVKASAEFQIAPHVRDASLERLRHHRHHRLLLVDARRGSIELIALVAGVSYFVLEKTIGEAFREGFKQSKSYETLRDFFRDHIDHKALFIAENVRRAFSGKKRDVRVEVLPSTAQSPNRLIVDARSLPDTDQGPRPSSLGEELDRAQGKGRG